MNKEIRKTNVILNSARWCPLAAVSPFTAFHSGWAQSQAYANKIIRVGKSYFRNKCIFVSFFEIHSRCWGARYTAPETRNHEPCRRPCNLIGQSPLLCKTIIYIYETSGTFHLQLTRTWAFPSRLWLCRFNPMTASWWLASDFSRLYP